MRAPMQPSRGMQNDLEERMSAECSQIDQELDTVLAGNAAIQAVGPGRASLSESALVHLRKCERCRRLYHWLIEAPADGIGSAVADSAAIEAVQARLKQTLKPVTPQASPRVLAAQFLLVFLLFSAPMIGMMGTGGLHEMNLTQLIGIVIVLICGAALLSFSLAWQMSPGSLHRVPPRIAMIALAGGFLAATAVLFPWEEQEAFLESGWSCLKAGLLMAAPSSLMFWLLVRRGHTMASGILGASLGAMAGLLGTSVLQFTCNRQDAIHLLVWHGGVVIAAPVLGFVVVWIVNQLLRTRA